MTRFHTGAGVIAILSILTMMGMWAGCASPVTTQAVVDDAPTACDAKHADIATGGRASLVGKWTCVLYRQARETTVSFPLPDVLELYPIQNSKGWGRFFVDQENGTLEGFPITWRLRGHNGNSFYVTEPQGITSGTMVIELNQGPTMEYEYTLSGSSLIITGATVNKGGTLIRHLRTDEIVYRKTEK